MSNSKYDAIVIGSGPNGLGAAVVLARAGLRVHMVEAEETIGGGTRTAELTLPGFRHDVCSAAHPMAAATRFLQSLPLGQFGLEWTRSEFALAHPLDDGSAAVLAESEDETQHRLGRDGPSYRRLIGQVARNWEAIEADTIAPLRWPSHILQTSFFWLKALRSAVATADAKFRTPAGRALFAGLAAHSIMPLEAWGSSAIAIILAAAGHRAGWPIARGGSQAIADALAGYLRSLGGTIETGQRVRSLKEVPPARVVMCDLSPQGLAEIAGERMPASYRQRLRRFQPGPGVFKMDWALDGPIPWVAEECRQAATIHLGGTLEEIAASERQSCAAKGAEPAGRPFVLLTQPSLFDPSRAPAGKHTAWAYCHVPNGCATDMTARIEAQVERFAPGFGKLILARSVRAPADIERGNANMIGGDIAGGRNSLRQMLLRPTWSGYKTPLPGVYLCSASTPPGGGVHGLCGYFAARLALQEHLQ